ncbi:Transposable element Tc3 transposase [Phytophthora citrophthora]|uniref:Transposable element Tc3 transposase n=1 Tax=Phytophthora citrophthora TaxID=4793 RepID=A0AAD9LDG2_9STRA|nr:Transposable element Tc3 transposase [Phytophthora citrophthora]
MREQHYLKKRSAESRDCTRLASAIVRSSAVWVAHVGLYTGCCLESTKERKKPGPAAALTERQTRLLLRTAAKGGFFARQIKSELSLSASVRTIQRVLADVDWLIYTKMDNTMPLSAEDKVAREEWAWARIFNTDSCGPWDSIIFSDEKK